MKYPELIVTARDIEEVKQLVNSGADAIRIGNQQYGLRVAGDFNLNEIEEATAYTHQHNRKIYVVTNAIFHNDSIDKLPNYLDCLLQIKIDGIICGDPSIFSILNDLNKSLAIHWNPETLATNHDTLAFWQSKGINRALLSNELGMDAVLEIKTKLEIPIEVQIHGMTCIFQSKRKLVTNYYNYINGTELMDMSQHSDKRLHLKQLKEPESNYPIFEDCNGTHVMSNEDLCMVDHIEPLINSGIDALRINGMMNSRKYNQRIVEIYRKAIDLCCEYPINYLSQIESMKREILEIQPVERILGTGFYFKEQIY
ncbi:U32 family peptidase [Aquibacillus halophilus]|uniref:U32 family peptidase n=1 Tax=Aquibacillus halophilus TaxID=930132 RepID=A0A6A8D9P6_9BACI|nr:peptidase U32 family protein [Aquibacillus halophilus]MRH42483.1 U32 family peptidase [Aquibacillus halophilus]